MAAKKHILVVDDEVPLARALELKFTNEGLKVTVAHNGQEALDLMSKHYYDLVLLDMVMPVLDGFELLAKLKKKGNLTPIIGLSNLGQEEEAARARELGAKDFFVKSNMPITEIVEFVKQEI